MLVGGLSTSINFLLITPFIPLLNSSTNSFPSYLLPLTTLLNSWTNSSIIFPSCSNFFNSATFTDSFSPPLNSFLMATKNFSTDSYSSTPSFRSSKTFFFQIFANPPYTNNNTHCTCSFTITPVILALIYSLQAVTNPDTFPTSPLNTSGLAIFLCDPSPHLPAPAASNACIWACITANCSCYWRIIACKSYWLMLRDKGKGVVGSRGRVEPMLVSPSDSYLDNEISISDSRPPSCPAYTFYWLPWLLITTLIKL